MSPASRGLGAGRLALCLPYAWLLVLFLAPFAIVAAISLGESAIGIPPYTPPLSFADGLVPTFNVNLGNYGLLLGDSLYIRNYLNSLALAGGATALCLLLGYPMAYAIAPAPARWRNPLLMLIILPFWTSFLIRVYAWIGILKTNGLINNLLLASGIVDQPLPLLNNVFSVELALVYSYLPFMILPLYATLERMDPALREAAADLGCRPFRVFLAVTLPLSLPGIAAGCLLVFIPAVGEFVIPDLLGGPDTLMIGKVLWDEFFTNRDPVASAVAIAMLVLLVAPIALAQRALRHAEATA
ncbi:MAG TPA: ABC transporter permease subunit [Stellaceae bacterium]|jgi:putrescine transport system permease protein|nr:ABC transporter permease subunit [Stellaceae bacterium]